ncbi:NifB/NifX family molybdenum-iron cluster-binding protein [Bacteroidota bacterium]
MKIAIATTDGEQISSHFGRSPLFAIFEVEDGEIADKDIRENTFTHHFKHGHESHSHEHGHHNHDHQHHGHGSVYEGFKDCQVVICRGMGQHAWEDLSGHGMEVITTEEKNCVSAVQRYLKNDLYHKTERLHRK